MKFIPSRRWALGVVLLIQVVSFPALAELGGDVSSIQNDQLKMKGTVQVSPALAYTVHEIQIPSGTVVREYVSAAGKVFAVTWRGPHVPDMQQTLGTYFKAYTSAPRAKHSDHKRFAIAEPGFVLQSSGHMRAYFGRAYVPQLLPQNVSVTDIQ
jgi:hypothetical protein